MDFPVRFCASRIVRRSAPWNLGSGGERHFRFFLIVGLMKGHVGGGSGLHGLSGCEVSVKFRPFLYVSICKFHFAICAGTAPGNAVFVVVFPAMKMDINLRV